MTEPAELSAAAFKARMAALQSDVEKEKYNRYFKLGKGEYGEGDIFMGVRMGHVFDLAKQFLTMEPAEIEALLESEIHEHRAGAMSIMAKQYQHKKTSDERKQALYELYLRRHDRINSWDLVDLAAWRVIGPHLVDRPRDILYQLARSPSLWERRTAILATFSFMRRDQFDDTFAIAAILLHDGEELVQKSVGWTLREAGADNPRLLAFLDDHAATMPRVTLRGALEKFDKNRRTHYMALAKR